MEEHRSSDKLRDSLLSFLPIMDLSEQSREKNLRFAALFSSLPENVPHLYIDYRSCSSYQHEHGEEEVRGNMCGDLIEVDPSTWPKDAGARFISVRPSWPA